MPRMAELFTALKDRWKCLPKYTHNPLDLPLSSFGKPRACLRVSIAFSGIKTAKWS